MCVCVCVCVCIMCVFEYVHVTIITLLFMYFGHGLHAHMSQIIKDDNGAISAQSASPVEQIVCLGS